MTRGWYVRLLVVLSSAVLGWFAMWPSVDAWIPAPKFVKEAISWRISPGLDIHGGLRLQYAVDIDEAVRGRRQLRADQFVERVCVALQICTKDVPPSRDQLTATRQRATVAHVGDRAFRVTFQNAQDARRIDRELLSEFSDLHASGTSSQSWTFALRDDAIEHLTEQSVSQARETIASRIDELGLREPSVSTRGQDVVVDVPGAREAEFERIREIIARTARLEFKVCDDQANFVQQLAQLPEGIARESEVVPVGEREGQAVSSYLVAQGKDGRERLLRFIAGLADRVPDDHELLIGQEEGLEAQPEKPAPELFRTYYVYRRAEVSGDAIDDTSVATDPQNNRPYVSILFNRAGADAFERLTGANVKRRMAIVLDDRVQTAPTIQQRIGGGRAQITLGGHRDYKSGLREAKDLVLVLRAGALPAPIRPEYEQIIGPTLGLDAVQQGVLGALLGITLVLVYMAVYYEVAGLVANTMVLLNVVLLLGMLALFGATLTLPGIAGIALTVGMAVDANVLINERMREELRLGKSPRQAVHSGFDKAFSAVIDSQLTTLIAGIVLFQYGSGPLRGFAVTLMIGIATSLFTGVFCARVAFEWLAEGLKLKRLRVGSFEFFKPDLRISVMKYARPLLRGALALTVIGVVLYAVPGPNLGIDFTGGTELQLAFRGDVRSGEVRTALAALGYSSPDVVAVQDRRNQYIVRVQEVSRIPQGFAQRARTALQAAAPGGEIAPPKVSPGGEKVLLKSSKPIDPGAIERALESAAVDVRSVTSTGRSADGVQYEVRLAGVGERIVEQLNTRFGKRGPEPAIRAEWVGARAGAQLRLDAAKALLYALAFIMVYIGFRFDLRFAPAAVLGLIHGVVVAAGTYVVLGREVNLTFVAALLTVIGYGVNDTVVVFDRIRENMQRMRRAKLSEIIDTSVSQNMSRTIMTGGSVMLSLIAFFIWGTSTIRDMSVALLIGIVTTTYTSVLVAAPLTEWMDRYSRRFSTRRRPAGLKSVRA